MSHEIPIAIIASETETSQEGLAELEKRYPTVPVEDAEVIVVLGGDGWMLHNLHLHYHLNLPFYGMNRGSVGFLLNEFRDDDLYKRIHLAKQEALCPLEMEATKIGGEKHTAIAFNEVSVSRYSHQSANLRIAVNDVDRLKELVCDGILLSTPAGSTAYNFSAHGPIIPLGSNVLALTPISPFRPRRWHGALLPRDVSVRITNLDPEKRPLRVSADFVEVRQISEVLIREVPDKSATLLFDRDQGLAERILSEQFMT